MKRTLLYTLSTCGILVAGLQQSNAQLMKEKMNSRERIHCGDISHHCALATISNIIIWT
ncbi:hypothetical protein KUH03_04800 [Sphingobacterium sp. E70]|uniref:hypothetical protein n=1 Tax=Sphingobacterium sp. E70 TaxID=2853439 RepID=UPI00211CBD1F|nr:hypothetical protein [Sphingobacterium sp. E70]ULT26244.1 hypothetical protein KUH03_04800 [Sphingobacterium sp. E70]